MSTFIDYYQKAIHENSANKGFWEDKPNIPEKLMLVVTEIADAFIRLLDLCEYFNIDIMKQISLKHHYNSLREHKHGKKF